MKEILIELFTLDSGGCAPCTYTKELVENAVKKIGANIKIIEHKIKDRESVILMKERGAKSIPTVCINGDIVYESILPSEEELIEEIKKRMGG